MRFFENTPSDTEDTIELLKKKNKTKIYRFLNNFISMYAKNSVKFDSTSRR